HAFMVIDGKRFDTVALAETGSRRAGSMTPTPGLLAPPPPRPLVPGAPPPPPRRSVAPGLSPPRKTPTRARARARASRRSEQQAPVHRPPYTAPRPPSPLPRGPDSAT